MSYYVTKIAGSILFRSPHKLHVLAGQEIPQEHWDAVDSQVRAEFLRSGMVSEHVDPDEPAPSPIAGMPVPGAPEDGFMPEAKVQPGKRVDAELERIRAEQEAAERAAAAAEADDVQVEVDEPEAAEDEDDEDDEGDDDLTPEERDEIRRLEQGEG